MAEIGSFALLLALALSLYSFLAGLIALLFQAQSPQIATPLGSPSLRRAANSASTHRGSTSTLLRSGSERIGETARRAGIATFGAVFLASIVLVFCAFRDDFSIALNDVYHLLLA